MNTAAKSIFGYSRNYASLEQIQGTGTDPRSDLYSLAATLYHLITNRPPDDALTRAMSVLSHKGDLLQPANQVNPAVPAGVAGVLQKALALNAGDRPATAADMKAMLQQSERFAVFAVGGGPIAPTQESPLFAQPTRLMSDDTQAADAPQTDVKTEVLPVYESQLTAVRDTGGRPLVSGGGADSFAPAGERRKRFGLAAAAAMVLLAVGVIAGGVLVLPGLMEPETPVSVSSDNTAAPPSQEASVADSQPASVEPGLVEGQTATNTAPEEPSKQTAAPKAPEQAAKTGKTRTGNPAEDAVDENNFDFEMNDNDVPESVVITRRDKNGKLHTTRVTPGARPPNVPDIPPNFNPFPPGFDPSKQMTPAEREQLKQLMRQRIRQQTNSQPPQE
jgi:hypothetical protein